MKGYFGILIYAWIVAALSMSASAARRVQAEKPPDAEATPRPLPPPSKWVDQLPEGATKSIVSKRCQICHDLQRVVAFSRPKDQWKDVVDTMMERGAPLSSEEASMVVDYLAENLGPAATHPPDPACAERAGHASASPTIPLKAKFSLWVSNIEGGGVDIIDPAVNKVVYTIKCITSPEGVIFSPDAKRAFIADRVEHNLTVVDTKSGRIIKKIPVTDRPNWAVITKDGKRIYVAIWPLKPDEEISGAIDVIDTTTLTKVRTIPTKGGIHDTWMSPDGKYFIAGSVMGKFLSVYDAQTEKIAWELHFNDPATTMTMESAPDGSTSRIFLGHEIAGFGVIDFATHKEVTRIQLPADEPVTHGNPSSHGIDITPDGKSVWTAGMGLGTPFYNNVYGFSVPDLKPLGHVHMADTDITGQLPTWRVNDGKWLSFSPDSKTIYVAVHGLDLVSVIDIKSMKEVARIHVGDNPLHISTWVQR